MNENLQVLLVDGPNPGVRLEVRPGTDRVQLDLAGQARATFTLMPNLKGFFSDGDQVWIPAFQYPDEVRVMGMKMKLTATEIANAYDPAALPQLTANRMVNQLRYTVNQEGRRSVGNLLVHTYYLDAFGSVLEVSIEAATLLA